MSWFFGYTGNYNGKVENSLKLLNPGSYRTHSGEGIKILFSRSGKNLLSNFSDNTGMIICGILLTNDEHCTPDFINNLLHKKAYDGHYAGISFTGSSTTLFNDGLGLRDIYYIQTEGNTVFSTRQDFITRLIEMPEINVDEFSSLWVLPHKISWGSLIKGIKRLGPGGYLTIEKGEHSFKRNAWNPDRYTATPEDFRDALEKAALFPAGKNNKINLGLSGGIDSRVLLQILCSSDYSDWTTHTFGHKAMPDAELSERITSELKIKHYFLEQKSLTAFDILNNKLYPQLELSSPIAGMINYSFFKYLDETGYTIIDGGNGEIFRRAFLNRFLLTAKDTLMNKDIEGIYNHLKREKADIFSEAFNTELKGKACSAIADFMDEMKSPGETGAELWADLFFIKTKAAAISGPSQAILDDIAVSYMPFVQASVMNSGFALNPDERNNGRLFMKLITSGKANLKKFPLVKDNIYYPFTTSLFLSRVIQKAKRKLGYVYNDNSKINAILLLEEFAKDRLNSQDVKSFAMYDYSKLNRLVTGFYDDKRTELFSQVDWWLSFEIWRERLGNKL